MPRFLRLLLLPAATMLVLPACQREGSSGMPPPGGIGTTTEFGVVTMAPRSVQRTMQLPGRVVAFATAEIRPRVEGIVRKIDFREGGTVQAGDILYELDDAKYQAASASAQAALNKALATESGAQATYDRNAALAEAKTISTQTLDDARTALLTAKAGVESARADLDTARINLDNTRIKAPISGRTDVSSVSIGSLVTEAQTTALTTIRQINPIHVDMVDSSMNMLNLRDDIDNGVMGARPPAPPEVALTLENGKAYSQKGQFTLAQLVVSETTGTFTVRATFPNPTEILLPGMFVSATVTMGDISNAFLVPQRALKRDTSGAAYVFLATADGKAEVRTLETKGTNGSNWIVTKGLSTGDKVIVDGFTRISAGAAVKPVEATINDDGVVTNGLAAPATPPSGAGAAAAGAAK